MREAHSIEMDVNQIFEDKWQRNMRYNYNESLTNFYLCYQIMKSQVADKVLNIHETDCINAAVFLTQSKC